MAADMLILQTATDPREPPIDTHMREMERSSASWSYQRSGRGQPCSRVPAIVWVKLDERAAEQADS
jgi:hypothetical protein